LVQLVPEVRLVNVVFKDLAETTEMMGMTEHRAFVD
jgi:hypothetical protein